MARSSSTLPYNYFSPFFFFQQGRKGSLSSPPFVHLAIPPSHFSIEQMPFPFLVQVDVSPQPRIFFENCEFLEKRRILCAGASRPPIVYRLSLSEIAAGVFTSFFLFRRQASPPPDLPSLPLKRIGFNFEHQVILWEPLPFFLESPSPTKHSFLGPLVAWSRRVSL